MHGVKGECVLVYIVQHSTGAVDIISHLFSGSDVAPERRSVCSFVTFEVKLLHEFSGTSVHILS